MNCYDTMIIKKEHYITPFIFLHMTVHKHITDICFLLGDSNGINNWSKSLCLDKLILQYCSFLMLSLYKTMYQIVLSHCGHKYKNILEKKRY